jgi:hypothetical protein
LNRFIGDELEVKDLSDFALTYDFDQYFFCWKVYSERALEPWIVPKRFLDVAFLDDSNDNAARAAYAASALRRSKSPRRLALVSTTKP